MRQRPDGGELLSAARRVLRDRILPGLAPGLKHDLLMVLNALSIAERQFAAGIAPEAAERTALEALFGGAIDDVAAAERRLVEALRRGDGDPGRPRRAAILAHLKAVARARLAESNPKVLERDAGRSGAGGGTP